MSPTQQHRVGARTPQGTASAGRAPGRTRQQRLALISAIVLVIALAGGGVLATVAASAGTGGAADGSAPTAAPDPSVAEGRTWTSTLTTSAGDITLELDGAAAPQAVATFVTLAQARFFDGTDCHRLTTAGIYVLQCGDPTGTGGGGPGFSFGPIENAPADDVYPAGTIAMARRSNDGASMGSQFFLVYQDSTIPSDAAGGYTVLGRITSGLDAVRAVADAGVAGGASDGAPATPVTIEGVEVQ